MIEIRELRQDDAPFMLEWMHDEDIQKGLKKRFLSATTDDVLKFINNAKITTPIRTGQSLHFAIADSSDDEYLGTISLKDIDTENGTAEYAIVTRKKAHGLGVAHKATGLLLKKAFRELGLRRVFLSVYSDNTDAIRLYEKSGFTFEGEFRDHFVIDGKCVGWRWYGILSDEYNDALFQE